MKCHKLWEKSIKGGGVKAKIKIVYISNVEHGILKSFGFFINRNRNSDKVPELGFLILFWSSSSGGSVCANIIDTKGCQKY